jgi:hypothetical protein
MNGSLELKRLDDLEAFFKLEYDMAAEQIPDKKTLAQLYFIQRHGGREIEYVSSEQTEKQFNGLFMRSDETVSIGVSNGAELSALICALDLNTKEVSVEKGEQIFSQLEEEKDRVPLCTMKIVEVVEKGNFRIGFCCETNSADICVKIVPPRSYEYDFFEKGRFKFSTTPYFDRDCCFLLFDPTKLPKDKADMIGKVASDRIGNRQIPEASRHSLTLEEFERICEVKIRQNEKRVVEAQILEKRLKEGGFSIGDVWFERDYISYQNQKIGIVGVTVYDYVYHKAIKDERTNFNALFGILMSEIFRTTYWHRESGVVNSKHLGKKIYVGSFPIVITNREQNNKTYYYVDDIRVSTEEIRPAVERALCFASADEYHAFLNSIREIPLRAHDMLVGGVTFKIRRHFSADVPFSVEVMFNVKREGRKYFLFAGDTCAHVCGGFNEILRLAEREYRSNFDIYLSMVEVLGDKDKTIKLIRRGAEEHAKVMERSKKLVDEIISKNRDKVKRISVNDESGLWVKGQLREYFVDNDANVWRYENGQATRRVCIVDKGIGRELCNIDRMITRVYWLLNDRYVVDKVHTLA